MRVLFLLAGDETRASTRYRILNLLPYLDYNDIEYDTISLSMFKQFLPKYVRFLLAMLVLIVRAPWYDLVYVQKTPLPAPYIRLLSMVTDVVYDFDDALYTTPSWEEDNWLRRRLLIHTLRNVQYVVAGNDELAAYAKQYANQVRCFSTPIPHEEYIDCDREAGGQTTIGWIGNPENLRYLDAYTGPIANVLDSHPNIRLLVITAGDLPVAPLADRENVEYREWTLETELDSLAEADIGIRPLFNDEWTRGKGGYTSVVQMLALGIPVVVTPVGMLTDLVVDGENGFLADSSEEWIDSLEYLIDEPSRRQEMGESAIETVEDYGFWTKDRATEFVEILRWADEQSGS